MAEYDLTATVNTVLGVSGKTSLVYIGYSQGLEIAFAELSTNKKLVSKIKLVVALAPVAYLANIKSPLRLLAPYANYVDVLLSILGINDFLPSNSITRWLTRNVFGHKIPDILCENIIFLFGGYNFKYMNSMYAIGRDTTETFTASATLTIHVLPVATTTVTMTTLKTTTPVYLDPFIPSILGAVIAFILLTWVAVITIYYCCKYRR